MLVRYPLAKSNKWCYSTHTLLIFPTRAGVGTQALSWVNLGSLGTKDMSQSPAFADLLKDYFGKIPQVNDLVKGKIISIDRGEVRIDINGIIIGVVRGEELFGESEAIGERIKIKGRNFLVIGILEKKGGASFINFDEMALMPYTTGRSSAPRR